MDEYENYKTMAKELFRLKNRLAEVEASEQRLLNLVVRVMEHRDLRFWGASMSLWLHDAEETLEKLRKGIY